MALYEINGTTSGNIKCPICKTGYVHFSVHATDPLLHTGVHVHAACTRTGCVNWRE